ncbi:MAG: nucleoside triphosphate pyrophosphohydrolase [Lentisphaerae bacterium GWF2_50_93]|nr:MAG: nucleoside triphosphate pyrophosphohydrolase [Lentisphaerae bacterium GWF2_50_93]
MAKSLKNQNPVDELISVMRKLRSEKGCPWDREQTHKSLKKYLVEESAELMDSIDDNDDQGICEELGDLLMHIVFHSQIAEEKGRFTFKDVADGITEKMIRRHPHVFADRKAPDSAAVIKMWDDIKKTEKKNRNIKRNSIMDGVPRHLPSLLRAHEIQRKAAKVGFDWSNSAQIIEKIDEEIAELKNAVRGGNESEINEEIGDLLFSVVNLARYRNLESAEEIIVRTIQKFERRFRYIEERLAEIDKTPEGSSLEEMEKLWNESKKKGL